MRLTFLAIVLSGCVSGTLTPFIYTTWLEKDLDARILRFGQKIQCPEPERVFSTTFDLNTGKHTCRYYDGLRYYKETKR